MGLLPGYCIRRMNLPSLCTVAISPPHTVRQSFKPPHLFGTGFSTSTDGGYNWTSSFLPPVRGSSFTFGDPSVAVDRQGNFYATGIGLDAKGKFTIQINMPSNGGITWSDAVVV